MKIRNKKQRTQPRWWFSKPRTRWRSEWNALLGVKKDEAIARETGMALGTVRARRLKLGIRLVPGFSPRAAWQPAWDKLLGTMPAAAVVSLTGASLWTVHKRCHKLGRSFPTGRPHRRGPKIDSPEMIARAREISMLREQGWTLQQIGNRLNISRERVRQILKGRS